MGPFIWLMDLSRALVQWRSASMEYGEQCVQIVGITVMPELCVDNWGTMSTQMKVRFRKRIFPYVKRNRMCSCET